MKIESRGSFDPKEIGAGKTAQAAEIGGGIRVGEHVAMRERGFCEGDGS